jgi:hypothetical protein
MPDAGEFPSYASLPDREPDAAPPESDPSE